MSTSYGSSPPSYSSSPVLGGYPQPEQPSPPHFRQRKSATIIPIPSSSSSSSSSDDGSIGSNPESGQPGDTAYTSGSTTPSFISPAKLEVQPSTRAEMAIPWAKPKGALPRHVRDISLDRRSSNHSSAAEEGEASETTTLLGSGERPKWYRRPLVVAGIKLGALFMVFTAIVVGTFYFCLPTLDPADKEVLKLPHSFDDLQALNALFQKYKREYPFRILACGVVTYLFVQTFSLPGSMYISILFGAAYGILQGLLLSCLCESVGSVFCYVLSSLLAPPLLTMPFYRARVETWRAKIMGDPKKGQKVSWMDVFAFLLVLRITPFPPHWIANFVSPHLGIGVGLFWLSCFIGIAPVSVIHVTIGSSLDSMTSAADFHILSLRNILGMIAVIVAILIPVGLKRIFKKDLGDLGEATEVIEEQAIDAPLIDVPPVEGTPGRRYQAVDSGVVLAGPSPGDPNLDTGRAKSKGKARAVEIITDIQEEDEDGSDSGFELYEPHRQESASPSRDEKRRGAPFRNYGAVDTAPLHRYHEDSGLRWPFTR